MPRWELLTKSRHAAGRAGRRSPWSRRVGTWFETLEIRAVLAAPEVWSPRGIGGGGALFSPSLNPADPNEMYVASDMGQVFHTTSEGATWDDVDFRELQGSHNARVQFTVDPLIRYGLDYTGDVVRPTKSLDGGVSWTPLAADPTGAEAYTLLVDYNNPDRVLVSDYAHLYLSTNGGTSFAQKFFTSDNNSGLHIAGAFFDGQNIYVGTGKGLLVSTNGGGSFVLASATGIPAEEGLVSFAGAKQNGTTRLFGVTLSSGDVYAGVGGADHYGYQSIYSLDYGAGNWTERTTGITAGTHPFYVSMAAGDINTAYLAGGNTGGTPTVFKTTSGGTSWQSVLLTTNNQNIATGWAGSGGDRGWSYGEFAEGFQVSLTNPNRLIITDLGFAHYSDDGGAHWRVLNVNPADRNPEGANTPKGREYRTSGLDNDTSWGVFWADQTHLIGAFSDIQGIISDDGGASWSLGYTGHTQNSLYRAVTAPNGTVYAATATVHDMYQSTYLTDDRIDGGSGKVIFSTNQGVAWTTLHDFAAPVVWVALDPNNPNRLYASVADSVTGGIYVSSDIQNGSASTWTKLAAPPRTQGHAFNIVVIDEGATSTLVATFSGRRASNAFTASSGVFVSTDGGATWLDRSDPGMLYWTKDIVIDPFDPAHNTWYAGVFSGWGGPPNGLGGLYKTTNRGVSWTRINDLDRVTSVTINPTNQNEMYLTTEVDGLWITANATAASPTFTPVTSYPFRQPERVFFNPYNPSEVWVTSFGNTLRVGNTASTGSVQGRQVFYNNSQFDGNNPAANASDDAAIATDKVALPPATQATQSNYTSYSRGINGVIVDLAGPPGMSITAADFDFRIGNTNTPASWGLAPAPTSVSVRAGAGAAGSNRVTLVWADGAIKNTWLQVTVKANANTGLAQPDVFYFGNAVGESGTTAGSAQVNSTDELAARNNPRTFANPAPPTLAFDYNRDGFVNATDQLLARSNSTTAATALKLIAFPAGLAAVAEPQADLSEVAVGWALRRQSELVVDSVRQPSNFADATRAESLPQSIAPDAFVAGAINSSADDFWLSHERSSVCLLDNAPNDPSEVLDERLVELLASARSSENQGVYVWRED